MNDKERPAEPVVGEEGTAQGGFAKVAEHLNTLYPTRPRPISRQLVHKWWFHRHFNGFPDAVDSKGHGNGGHGRPVFDKAAVTAWYVKYLETRRRHSATQSPQEPANSTTAGTSDGDTLAA